MVCCCCNKFSDWRHCCLGLQGCVTGWAAICIIFSCLMIAAASDTLVQQPIMEMWAAAMGKMNQDCDFEHNVPWTYSNFMNITLRQAISIYVFGIMVFGIFLSTLSGLSCAGSAAQKGPKLTQCFKIVLIVLASYEVVGMVLGWVSQIYSMEVGNAMGSCIANNIQAWKFQGINDIVDMAFPPPRDAEADENAEAMRDRLTTQAAQLTPDLIRENMLKPELVDGNFILSLLVNAFSIAIPLLIVTKNCGKEIGNDAADFNYDTNNYATWQAGVSAGGSGSNFNKKLWGSGSVGGHQEGLFAAPNFSYGSVGAPIAVESGSEEVGKSTDRKDEKTSSSAF